MVETVATPQILYHGTITTFIPSFQTKLLNKKYWKPGKDFGEGFYCTSSKRQAQQWARKMEALTPGSQACILKIVLMDIPKEFSVTIFLGENLNWGKYIFDHRMVNNKNEDPCQEHSDLIIGPMADNDTGKIVADAVSLNKDYRWFYEQIIRSKKGRRLDAFRLGMQIVFSIEDWEQSLELIGFYTYVGGRWVYHENKTQSQQL